MPESRFGVALQIHLAYQHSLGELSPYFSALQGGRLLGTTCHKCSCTWLPPRLICRCGEAALAWQELAGTGTVEFATRTFSSLPGTDVRGDMIFVLVRFDGSSNLSLARCLGDKSPEPGARVRLKTSTTAPRQAVHPVQALEVEIV